MKEVTLTTETKRPDYEALGIFPDTWACVSIGTKADVKELLFCLAVSGVEALASRDGNGKQWHVAVKGGLAASPLAYVVSLRGLPYTIPNCPEMTGQHPRPPQPETT